MKNLSFYLILALSVLLFSCKSKSVSFEKGNAVALMDVVDENIPPPPPPPMANVSTNFAEKAKTEQVSGPILLPVSKKIIKDGRMEIRVKELETGKKQIGSLVRKLNCYYAEETYNNQGYSRGYSLKIRIPADQFEQFIAQAESGIGELAFKDISSRDVTEQFIDLETRLKNKRNYLNRYNELLAKARSVKDILEIEENTRLIEEEIESTEGRLKYLSNQVDFSTLDLQISGKNDYNLSSQNEGTFLDRFKLSLVKGWFGLVKFTLFIFRIWPFWIIVTLIYYFTRKILKRRKMK
jgi:hypothetical protein